MYEIVNHRRARGALGFCVAVVSAIALSACGATQSARSEDPEVAGATSAPMTSEEDDEVTKTKRIGGFPANFYGSKRVQAGKPVKIDAGDDYFEPTVVTGPGGSRVTLVFTNSGESIHSFTSGKLKIDEDIEVGKSIRIVTTIPSKGQVVFICRYHEYGGMVGAVEVR